MKWSDFLSDDTKIRIDVEREFEWMRKFAYCYYRKFINNPESAEDFAHGALEKFITQLKQKNELNRSYYKRLVRFFFLDEMRRGKQQSNVIQADDFSAGDADEADILIESLPDPGQSQDQELYLKNTSLIKSFKEVLGTLSRVHQQIVMQRLIGFSSLEVSQSVSKDSDKVSVNLINVVYHKFRKEMQAKCLSLELIPE